MAIYNVTNVQVTQLESRIGDAKTFLESRRVLWNALSPEKKRTWINGTIPDPILAKMWALYQFLKQFFGEA